MVKSITHEIMIEPRAFASKVGVDHLAETRADKNETICSIAELISDEISRNPSVDLRNMNQISSTAERLRILSSAALFLEHRKGCPNEAFELLEYALLENPVNMEILKRLEFLAEKTGNWEQLCKTATQAMHMTSSRQKKANLCLQIGDWCHIKLHRSDWAVLYFSKSLEIDSSNLCALKRLSGVYRENEQWKELSAALVAMADSSDDRAEKIELFFEAGCLLLEKLDNPESAVACYNKVLEEDPEYTPAIEKIIYIYEEMQRWEKLNRILNQQNEHKRVNGDTWPVLVGLGKFFESDLGDHKKAKKCYEQTLDQNPNNVDALEGLARIYSATEDWTLASGALYKLYKLDEVPEKKVDYLYRIGQIMSEKTSDLQKASEYYQEALTYDKNHRPSLTALRSVHMKLENWQGAIQILTRETKLADKDDEKSKLAIKIGQIYENLSQSEDAIYWYNEAAKRDPSNLEAKMSLVRVLLDVNRHEELEPLLADLSSTSLNITDTERFYICLHLAMVRQSMGDDRASLEPARIAFEISSSSAATAVYARALLANNRLQEAHDTYLSLLSAYSNEMSHVDLVKFVYLLGQLATKLNLRSQAIEHFSRVFEEEPDDLAVLKKIIELCDFEKDYARCVRYRVELDRFLHGAEKFTNYVCIGDICATRLKDVEEATYFYQRALKVKPNDPAVLSKLIPIYQYSEQWELLIEALRQSAKLEEEPEKISRCCYTMGLIYRDKLGDFDAARDCFQEALFHDYTDQTSFDALENMLMAQGRYNDMESFLWQMIFRMNEAGEGTSQRALQLWHILGELYRVHLGKYYSAAKAYEQILLTDPDDIRHRELVAVCKLNVPKASEEAIEEYRGLIAQDPDNESYYHPLFNILYFLKRYDEAWCVAGALCLMEKATARERDFYETHVESQPQSVKNQIDEQMFGLLKHTDDLDRVSDVFGVVQDVLIKKSCASLESYDVTKTSSKIRNRNRHIADLFYYAAECLNLKEIPKLYFKKREETPFTYMLTKPIASLCGEWYANECTPKEILFLAVNHLTYYRYGCLFFQLMFSDSELKSLLIAALRLGNIDHKTSNAANALGQLLDVIKKADLQNVTELFFATDTPPSICKWLEDIELTAARTAMLLTGDLVVAASMIRSSQSQPGQLSKCTIIADLQVFSISSEYATLRHKLGLSIRGCPKRQTKKENLS